MNVLAHTTTFIVELRRNDTGDAHIVQLLESYVWTHQQHHQPEVVIEAPREVVEQVRRELGSR